MAQEPAVTPAKPELPGYWHFAWMFFMQPVTLYRWLKASGIEEPNISGWKWWKRRSELAGCYRVYFLRLLFLVVLLLLASILLGLGAMQFGLDVNWRLKASLIAFGAVVGVAAGVELAIVGVAVAASLGMTTGMADDVVLGAVLGMVIGAVLGAPSIVTGVVVVVSSVALGSVTVVALAAKFTLENGVTTGITIGVPMLLMFFRIPFYPLEALMQTLLFLTRGSRPERTLRFSPILFHNLSYLPHPFLARHIVATAENAPDIAIRVHNAALMSPGQRNAARRALAECQAKELAQLAQSGRFAQAAELHGRWLSGQETANPLQRGFAETARFVLAAEGASSAHIRLQHLEAALNQLQNLDKRLTAEGTKLDAFLRDTLSVWRQELETRLQAAQYEAAQMIPNPYTAGNPLSPEMKWEPSVFRGREDTVRQVEALLADSRSAASIALIGPRRCGKTSLLNMLPVMLPDTLVVVFDLQDNPVSTPQAFYQALARRARQQALRERRLELPPLPEGPPIEALGQWLEALENFATAERILICIDEFERLEHLFPGEPRDLLQFMGLMRATIQHRRRVRLLVSGAAPSDEMGRLWNDHFINLREIRIGFLDEPTSVALLTKPVEEFPSGTISPELALEVFRRSGGQPYLTQLFGWLLVDRLNVAERRAATLEDLAPVEEKVLGEANGYFSNTWDDATPAERDVLVALAENRPCEIDESCRRRLARRLLIGKDGNLAVPVFGRWLREKRL